MAKWKIEKLTNYPPTFGVYRALGPWPLKNWSWHAYKTFRTQGDAKEWVESGEADKYYQKIHQAYDANGVGDYIVTAAKRRL